jgi:acyl-CoA synthetase (AMP-forming)/AMP-acid ligase II
MPQADLGTGDDAPQAVHLYRGRPPARPFVRDGNFLSPLRRHAEATPSAPFLTEAGPGEGVTLTYAEAFLTVAGTARALRDRGIGPGDRVALVPLNDALSVLTIFATVAAGATAVLLSRSDPPGRLREQVAAADVRVTVECGAGVELPGPALEASALRAEGARGDGFHDWPGRAGDPAVIMFTTGTTSSSKGVVQTHGNIALNTAQLAAHHALGPGSRLLGVLPVHYANGLEFTVVATMVAGGHVLLMPDFDAFGYLRTADRLGATLASVVPGMLDAVTPARSVPDLSRLRYFASAAAPLTAQTARRVHERLGRRVVQGYGLTETTNFSTIMPVDQSEEGYRRWILDADIPSVGPAVFGNDVAVLDEIGSPLPDGDPGEICMRGHSVMAGYYGNPAATAEAFEGGWFHSGDLGYLSREPETGARLLTITGRLKNMIKCSGRALSLDEMDRLLRALPGVLDAVALPVPDPYHGELPAIALVVAEGSAVQEEAVRQALDSAMATAGLPVAVRVVPSIPRTGNGKIARRQVSRELFPARHARAEAL